MNTIYKYILRNYSFKCATKSRAALTMANSQLSNPNLVNIKEPVISSDHDSLEMHISLFPYAVRDSVPRMAEPELVDAIRRFDDLCYYTGPNRELYSSLILIDSYKILEDPAKLTSENLKLASILAWCFENATTAFIVQDDIMDDQGIRWKKKCWHVQPHIGLTALIDAKLFSVSSYILLKKYFKNHPSYVQFMNLLAESIYKTAFGQSADCNSCQQFKVSRNIEFLSQQKYVLNVFYKSSCLLYTIPVFAAMQLANVTDLRFFNAVEDILIKLSICRQAQNDMWDVYGKYETTGKYGTDLIEGKCTWLTATVVEHGTDQQKALFCKNYGRGDAMCQNTIINLYDDLEMVGKFLQYKKNLIADLNKKMEDIGEPKMKRLIKLFLTNYVNIDEDFKKV